MECLCLTTRLKFYKVVYRHYSVEVKNVYMILQEIYSGNYKPNFV